MYTLTLYNFRDENQYITISEDGNSLGLLYSQSVDVSLLVRPNIFESSRHTRVLHLACSLLRQNFPFVNCQAILNIDTYEVLLKLIINSNYSLNIMKCYIENGSRVYDNETFRTSIDEWHPICDTIKNWLTK